jgi:hypothetical protein
MLRFSKNIHFLFFCVLLIFCFYQTVAAQSGRRINKNPSSVQQNAPIEAKSTETEQDAPTNEMPVQISSMIVVGEVQHNFKLYKSNEIDVTLKECVTMLKSSSKALSEITKGSGKMGYKEAKELARKEIDTFVLWIGFSAKDDGYGNMYIDTVQYALLTPETAKVVTRGEIQPKQNGVLSSGGVLNIPNGRRISIAMLQMRDGAREIVGILLRGGWLD